MEYKKEYIDDLYKRINKLEEEISELKKEKAFPTYPAYPWSPVTPWYPQWYPPFYVSAPVGTTWVKNEDGIRWYNGKEKN